MQANKAQTGAKSLPPLWERHPSAENLGEGVPNRPLGLRPRLALSRGPQSLTQSRGGPSPEKVTLRGQAALQCSRQWRAERPLTLGTYVPIPPLSGASRRPSQWEGLRNKSVVYGGGGNSASRDGNISFCPSSQHAGLSCEVGLARPRDRLSQLLNTLLIYL